MLESLFKLVRPNARAEKVKPLRVRAHPRYAELYSVRSVLQSGSVQRDRPAGPEELEYALNNQESAFAKGLKKERGWRNLKFVFPGTCNAESDYGAASFLRWNKNFDTFQRHTGGASFKWMKDFRTVHKP